MCLLISRKFAFLNTYLLLLTDPVLLQLFTTYEFTHGSSAKLVYTFIFAKLIR